ncbi:serine/threonine-protein kinase [Fortiea contorta]|uniref:serine/threonine-protein kinase n=1 Tax=Fortiea contorta TaxID=1892405 RepID=UPI0004756391|nr:serine/threonine-protein kinase [Fortiea contorta]
MICCLNPDCPNPLNPDSNKLCQTCSTPLIPLLRNRFRVIRVLSDEGGFGRTYLSQDIDKLNERCVIKQLAPKFQGTWSQKKAMELFAEEAKRLQELGEHPQIPTLVAYFEQDHCMYLVQQFINGENLLKELQRRKVYKDRDIQAILLDILPILKFIHERGVIHRDLKPENIIRSHLDGRLSLIDFGSSKQFTSRVHNKIGTSIGSHGYSPIEQIRDGKAYPASDLFGLGATCFHLLTGISPFQLWMEHGYAWVASWRQYLRSPINAELDYVLDKLLQKDIQYRYQTTSEVIRELAPKSQLLLPPANSKATRVPTNQTKFLPRKFNILKSLVLVSAFILLFGFGDAWYQQYQHIQASLASRLSRSNHRQSNSEAVLSESATIALGNVSLAKTLKGGKNSILSVAISPDGKMIASNSDRTIKLWNLATGEEISTLNGHSLRVNVVSITPDGKTLVSGSDDNTIKVWNLATGKPIHTLIGHSDSVHALAISPDGKTIIDGSDDNTIKVWNLSTGQIIRTLVGHEFWVRSIVVSPDGQTLASGSFDKTIKVWNLAKGYAIRTLENAKTITCLAISPDGKILASASRDRTIKLWNLASGEEISTLMGHANTVTSVSFSPDGKTLVSGSRDRTIKLWNLSSKEEIFTLVGHTNTVTSVSFSPDGKTLVSGSDDHTIKIWRVAS